MLTISISLIIDYTILCEGLSGSGQGPLNNGASSMGNGQNHHNSKYFSTILRFDTDTLADFLESKKSCNYIGNTGIKFSTPNPNIPGMNPYNEEISRIARFVRANHDFFYRVGPNNTPIEDSLISGIRDLKKNVPTNFR